MESDGGYSRIIVNFLGRSNLYFKKIVNCSLDYPILLDLICLTTAIMG